MFRVSPDEFAIKAVAQRLVVRFCLDAASLRCATFSDASTPRRREFKFRCRFWVGQPNSCKSQGEFVR